MATTTLKYLLDIIAGKLQDVSTDEDDRHWPVSDLIHYYNVAVLEIISQHRKAHIVTESVKFASGSKQSIPAKSIAFVNLIRNMGTDGATPGESITQTFMDATAAFNRTWSEDTAGATIYNVMPDAGDPRTYYIYPPSDGTTYGLLQTSKAPDKVTYDANGNWESTLVAVTDEYVEALMDKIMEHAYQKDSDYPGNKAREDDMGNEFLQEMATKNQ